MASLTHWLRRLERAALHGEEVPAWLEPLTRPTRWLWVFYRAMSRDQAFLHAAAMAYTSLIALVPLLLLVFAVLDATGLLEANRVAIEALIFESFLGDIHEVKDILVPGLLTADVRTLGLIGVAGLAFAAWRLYVLVEAAYCGIFGVELRRPMLNRVLLFYVGITIAPVVFVASFLRTTDLLAEVGVGFGREMALFGLQYVMLLGALKFFPDTRVKWVPALTGAGVSLALLMAEAWAFRLYLTMFSGGDPVRVIYGSLGALPVFLLWLYLVWVALLVGVEVASVAQNYRTMFEAEYAALHAHAGAASGVGVDVALLVAAAVAHRFEQGQGASTAAWVAERTGMSEKAVAPVLAALDHADLLVRTDDGYILSRPSQAVGLQEVVRAWRGRAVALPENPSTLRRIRDELDLGLDGTLDEAVARWCDPQRGEGAPPADAATSPRG